MQESIVRNFWLQFGAAGILALSGWGVAWVLWKEYKKKMEAYIVLLERVTALAEENKAIFSELSDRIPEGIDQKLDQIADGLGVQRLFEEFLKEQKRFRQRIQKRRTDK